MTIKLSKQTIHEMRRLVLSGMSKYMVAKTLQLSSSAVYYHTKDLPRGKPGNRGIRGNTLELLKQLLMDGYILSSAKNSSNLHTIKKHFPNVKRTQIDGKSVYYLNDKKKQALEAMIKQKQKKIMSYTDLSTLSTVFDVHLKIKEKQRFIGKKNKVSYPKMETSRRRKQPNSKENDSADEGFLGRILHSGVLSSYIFNFC
jgi:predicted transcriptional regulator